MADEEKEVAVEQPQGNNMLKILMGAVILIVGVVGGLFAADFIADDKGTDATEAVGVEGSTEVATANTVDFEAVDTVMFNVGHFDINLNDSNNGSILQLEVFVECEPSVQTRLQSKHVQISDAIVMFTSEYTAESLSGMEGKMDLRDEILLRVNAIMKPQRVERVYFQKFLIGQ